MAPRRRLQRCAVSVFAPWLAACAPSAEPRAQLVVTVDSDAPITSQLRLDPSLSAAAAIDTLVIEQLEADGTLSGLRRLVVPDVTGWPVTFGVATPAGGGGRPLVLRLRAHAGGAVVALRGEPVSALTIDRLVELTLPEEGIVDVAVLLSLDCFGRPARFSPPASCVDAERLEASPGTGVETIAAGRPETRAGTSPIAAELTCIGSPPSSNALCIPGGFSIRGALRIPEVRLQPMIVHPFFIDLTEFTVRRFRPFASQVRKLPESTPILGPCNWQESDRLFDSRALNCLEWETALEACQLARGTLPSAAQWEHAARGRGLGRRFPWGEALPDACGTDCSDVSRDGVLDLGGGVTEMVMDSYPETCEEPGIVHDPLCVVAEVRDRSARGGSDGSPRESAYPHPTFTASHIGFRCVYADGS
jgi:hypothetical protein